MWTHHPAWSWWRVTRPVRWASWGSVTGWCYGGGYFSEPVYYDYGDNVVYEDNSVYVNNEYVATTDQYAQEAIDLAALGAQGIDTATEQQTADQIEWLPLGVYALTRMDEGEPTMFLQLAVSKEGTIGGSLYNAVTNETLAVEGAVDRDTQRVAVAVSDRPGTVLETGLGNLTQDESTALVHFGTERTETLLLVRLDPEPAPEQ